MKTSIITVVYNRVETIAHAVKSVAQQSYSPLEHIIQDGGSTDGTLQVLAQVCSGLTSVTSEPDSGIYDAINRGISRATGEIIGLMHSDDFFAHDHVLEMVASAFSDPRIDGVYGDLHYVAAEDPTRIIRHWRAGTFHPENLRRGWMPPHPTLYLRREVFQRWGLYDTSFRIAADYDAVLRYLVKGQIQLAYIPEVLVKMRVGGESNRTLGQILRKSREDLHAIHRNQVGGIGTLAWKNFGKIRQFIHREGNGV